MVRLSIVIPAQNKFEQLESSLVSVLSNRPPHTEVVVVTSESYSDPYHLTDEVRFVAAGKRASWADCANLGVRESAAPIVNVISAGVQVCEAWSAAALRHFDDPRVGSVAPLVVDAEHPDRVLATGVQYQPAGTACLTGVGISTSAALVDRTEPLGPTRWAGFYRREAMVELLDGFARSVGESFCDVDLAARMQYVGFHCVGEPRSRVLTTAENAPSRRGFGYQRAEERLFWRNLVTARRAGMLLKHSALVAREMLQNAMSPALIPVTLGRLLAMCEAVTLGPHRARLRQLQSTVESTLEPAVLSGTGRTLRIDAAQKSMRGVRATGRPVTGRLAA